MKDASVERAVRAGWILLALSLPLGVTLEALHGLKLRVYLESGLRRELWRLAHAHGTLLGILLLAFAAVAERHVAAEQRAAVARDLVRGCVLLPLGFFLGGSTANAF